MAKTITNATELLFGKKNKVQDQEPEQATPKRTYKDKAEKKTEMATLLLRQQTKEQLRDMAWKQRRSFNDLVTQILEDYLKENYED